MSKCATNTQSNVHTMYKYYSFRGGEFFNGFFFSSKKLIWTLSIWCVLFGCVRVYVCVFSLQFAAMFRHFQIKIFSLFSKR